MEIICSKKITHWTLPSGLRCIVLEGPIKSLHMVTLDINSNNIYHEEFFAAETRERLIIMPEFNTKVPALLYSTINLIIVLKNEQTCHFTIKGTLVDATITYIIPYSADILLPYHEKITIAGNIGYGRICLGPVGLSHLRKPITFIALDADDNIIEGTNIQLTTMGRLIRLTQHADGWAVTEDTTRSPWTYDAYMDITVHTTDNVDKIVARGVLPNTLIAYYGSAQLRYTR